MATSWLLSLKLLLISSGVVSLAVIFNLTLPALIDFLTTELPLLCSSAHSWLRPPYLYIFLNCIILTIVASSKLQPRTSDNDAAPEETNFRSVAIKVDDQLRLAPVSVDPVYESEVLPSTPVVFGYVDDSEDKAAPIRLEAMKMEDESVNQMEITDLADQKIVLHDNFSTGHGDGDGEFVLSRSTWTPPLRDDVELSPVSSEKPLPSARFSHRKAIKASPEGKALGVSKSKRHNTLEATWRTITEGRPMPLTRHLRKSDTLESRDRAPQKDNDIQSPVHVMKKSETFNESRTAASAANGNSLQSPGSGKLKREPSLSHDELNRRVEAFIRKFNEDMRLQRQESLNQYRHMLGPGTTGGR